MDSCMNTTALAPESQQTGFFKTELHLHTRDASPCADAPAKLTADKYAAAGYSTVVVTNHFSNFTKNAYGCADWKSYIDLFLKAWEKVKYYAGDRLNVLLGAEVRYDGSMNDYLVYGLTPEYLYDHPDMLTGGPFRNIPKLRNDGLLVYQAHPFRVDMKIMPLDILDGYEVFNGHIDHQSFNDIAYHYSTRLKKPMISGSDHHKVHQPPTGGIISETKITSNDVLLETLRQNRYLLISAMLEHLEPKSLPLEILAMIEENDGPPPEVMRGTIYTDDDIPNQETK